jgi:hypothetical protein
MDPSGLGLGGLKAGAPTDPLAFIKRPSVVIRICSLVGLIVPDLVCMRNVLEFYQEVR